MARIAVTGAGGRVGGQVLGLLRHRGCRDLVAVTRQVADYDDLPALRRTLTGVDTLVLVGSDGESDRMLRHHLHLVDAAAACRIAHVVLLSSVDADLDSPFCYARVNALTEAALASTRCAVTPVRVSLFAEFLAVLLDDATTAGELRVPAGEGRVAPIARADVAGCLAAAAVAPPADAPVVVTGPALLDLGAIAARRGVRYVDVPPSAYAAALATRESPWWAYAYSGLLASVREQRWSVVTDQVLRLTGESARPWV